MRVLIMEPAARGDRMVGVGVGSLYIRGAREAPGRSRSLSIAARHGRVALSCRGEPWRCAWPMRGGAPGRWTRTRQASQGAAHLLARPTSPSSSGPPGNCHQAARPGPVNDCPHLIPRSRPLTRCPCRTCAIAPYYLDFEGSETPRPRLRIREQAALACRGRSPNTMKDIPNQGPSAPKTTMPRFPQAKSHGVRS